MSNIDKFLILVLWGCWNNHRQMAYTTNTSFSQFWRLGNPRQRHWQTWYLMKTCFPNMDHSLVVAKQLKSLNEAMSPAKAMTSLSSILKSRDITLLTKVHIVKALVFPVVMYGCKSWTIRKAECRRVNAFELWC